MGVPTGVRLGLLDPQMDSYPFFHLALRNRVGHCVLHVDGPPVQGPQNHRSHGPHRGAGGHVLHRARGGGSVRHWAVVDALAPDAVGHVLDQDVLGVVLRDWGLLASSHLAPNQGPRPGTQGGGRRNGVAQGVSQGHVVVVWTGLACVYQRGGHLLADGDQAPPGLRAVPFLNR